jgi:uncharacterized membrane protein
MDDSTAMAEAKRPRTAIAGPYGHPIHPVIVVIPIGTWLASLVFDIIGLAADDPEPYAIASRILILIGLIGAVLAAIFGLIDFSRLAHKTAAHRTAEIHMIINLSVAALFLVNLLVRWFTDHDTISVVGFILTIIGIIAIGVSGWLGGKLVFHYGVRVADETTQREGYVPTPPETR